MLMISQNCPSREFGFWIFLFLEFGFRSLEFEFGILDLGTVVGGSSGGGGGGGAQNTKPSGSI